MRLTILKITKTKSKFGDYFYYIFLKGDNGASFKTCIYPKYGNYLRNKWDMVIAHGEGTILDYDQMPITQRGLLNADIAFTIIPKEA